MQPCTLGTRLHPHKNQGCPYREADTHTLCCRVPFDRFDRSFAHRSSPIGNCLRLFRWQDGKWRNSQGERHDRCAPNAAIWDDGARNQPTQWSLGGCADQRSRTIRARPGHRHHADCSPPVGLLWGGARDARRCRQPRVKFYKYPRQTDYVNLFLSPRHVAKFALTAQRDE